ncbi:MAG: HAD-IB family hydrolase [Bacteroidia bacterium]|nr:HAD-IB family hydrolase [Bacteroidia bacterium]
MSWTKAPDPQGIRVAAFDLDGTLTRQDTMWAFLRLARGWGLIPRLLPALPALLGLKLGLVQRRQAKEALLRAVLGGMRRPQLERLALRFAQERMPALLRPAGWARLQAHRADGDEAVIVTASLDLWLGPWAAEAGIPLLASQAAFSDDRFAGLAGPNCYGPEKVRRLGEWLAGRPVARLTAYGDSGGDRELLAAADEAHWRPFQSPANPA